MNNMQRRKIINGTVLVLSTAAAMIGLVMLTWILGDVAIKGASAINWDFFTQLPSPPGDEGGGLANAIVGTLLMTVVATLISVPFGVMAGTYLSEFGRQTALGSTARFVADILVSAPSIVIGVFVYLLVVKTMGNFSGWAGAIALSIIMLPVITRTTEEMLRMVPKEMRESALALGAPYWKMLVQVIYRCAMTGMITGIMLAVARVAGETAPLLFTSLNSPYWMQSMNEPMANMTVALFNYAMSPYDDWHAKAWGMAFLITMSVLVVTIITRISLHKRS
ncbi:MAG: phosphate ABC transporter, permease protein PstA [Zetaproteobacteria bacterium CG12_big_fil_rev_8_21_14_0_65_55_1124]|nr:MAG: phosphate ABC transporter, permease protein PstA [Zetaproteobacteria bacterium CG1_02_55_237]PIS18615.1 MAG: phosphate ABC transporter, permease protein PstA [Zetaproteobacteria bacterium CG08_land_8_20_14_0_20_55_17]PIW43311.1 MAG: phosphate ABC transporter, permease protein PstA [Zetaproteobacteria bacterium CG12_big_fil_rev_8_21_14_0_65_55_1124]PIY53045.1 MAG: phosphate ABC transporter, permease protein PstA [Zetaproteobacteria bacterium CG_4_10_14_0_8_um_filter_55_43]PIZ37476.1 MAG: